jgi:signal transduction histidine kinase
VARVLHIEDDPVSLLLVRELLAAAGHEVIEARDGIAGTVLAKETIPDIVLVDINIPGLDGYEVILRLRGMAPLNDTPIVALTAEGDRETSLAVGADGFVQKPIDAEHFIETIERFLGGHRETADRDVGEQKLRSRTQLIVERLERIVVELYDANLRLEEMARLRREFLRNLSHEFATPMTPVVGYLRLLLNEEMGPLTPMQRRCIESIDTSTQKLRSLVDTLLDISSLEMGKLHLYERDYDLSVVIERAVDETRHLFDDKGVTLVREEPVKALPARGDPDKLLRAVVHIIDNAVKFTPRGGEVVIGTETIGAGKDDAEGYRIIVADSGHGISAEAQEKILAPFFQVDGSTTRSAGGVGIGLAFARHVARGMGGGIEIHSPPKAKVAGRELGGTAIHLTVKKRPQIEKNEK